MSKVKSINYKELFKKGEYELLKKSFDKKDYSEVDFPWVLAGMCFLGRIDELKIVIKKRELSSFEYFFLTISATRLGDYDSAKKWISELRVLMKEIDSDEVKFFYYQAMAFYSHLHCRYRISLSLAKRSHRHALFLEETLWKVLSIDLLGHNYIQMGNIHQGLFYLNEGKSLSEEMGNLSWVAAANVSILSYKSQFSEHPDKDKVEIKRYLKKIKNNDNYSEGLLLLSLSHLEILMGEIEDARIVLNQAQAIIFGNQIKRHMGIWHFEKAYLNYLMGDLDSSLIELNSALNLTTTKTDRKLRLKILGLKLQIGDKLNRIDEKLEMDVLELSKILGDPRSHNQLARRGKWEILPSEDPLDTLFNKFASENWQKAIPHLVSFSFWGLFREKVADKKKSYLVLGLWKSGVLFLTSKTVLPIQKGLSELLLKALLVLNSKKTISKEELLNMIWGFEYDPLRHDTLVFSLIHRLKKVMGILGHEIKGEAHHYSLGHQFEILSVSPPKDEVLIAPLLQGDLLKNQSFNIRQQQAMIMMKKGRFFQASDYAEEFKVTTMTALRDLTELIKHQKIVKYGRARATTYGEHIQ